MTPIQYVKNAIALLEASLATDFLTDSVRDIMTRSVADLKEAEKQLGDLCLGHRPSNYQRPWLGHH